jgi:hypothetical protein
VSGLGKVIVYIKPKFEELDVEIHVYDSEGKMIERRVVEHAKQIVINAPEVRISRQLFYENLALIIESNTPSIDVKETGLVRIKG